MRTASRSFLLLIAMALSACSDVSFRESAEEPGPLPGAAQSAAPAPAPAAAPVWVEPEQPVEQRPRAEIFRGTAAPFPTPRRHVSEAGATTQGDITLTFVNADVREVAQAVLGGILQLNYEVDPKVQGTVTMTTSQPLPKESLLPVFEQSLRLSGLAIIRQEKMLRIVPASVAPRQSGVPVVYGGAAPSQAGYGVAIVPLRYIGAAEMQRLLDPLTPSGSVLSSDPKRNVLMIAGSERERALMLETIGLFDVNQLAGMSFALFHPHSVGAAALAKSLGELLDGAGGGLSSVVRLVALERMGAVLAISPQADYLDDLTLWVERLDRPGEHDDQRLFVYPVQHGRAADLAAVLSKALKGDGAATSEALTTVAVPPLPDGGAENALAGSGLAASARRRFAGLTITPDDVNNALVILATPKDYATVQAALHQLDLPPLQVLLEAVVVEVTLTDDLKYGVQYLFQSGNSRVVHSQGLTDDIKASFPGFSYVFSEATDIRVVLHALDTMTDVEVISAPKLLALNNQTATLQVGDEVPVATQQAQSTASADAPIINTIQFRDTGVILKVTPRVNQGGMVLMDISQEVSDVSSTTTSNLNSPTISERKITSTVAVRDGETIALGGLIKDSRARVKDGLPLLHQIPLLGALFGSTGKQSTRTELLVLITPRVVDGSEKARALTRELRQKLPAAWPLLQRGEAPAIAAGP